MRYTMGKEYVEELRALNGKKGRIEFETHQFGESAHVVFSDAQIDIVIDKNGDEYVNVVGDAEYTAQEEVKQ
jgi:hypothetical protein